MKPRDQAAFFVGWRDVAPPGLRVFLPMVAAGLLLAFAALGFAMSAAQDHPGDGAFRFDLGAQTLTGVLHSRPYPTLTITEGNADFPAGRVLLLSGQGKRGAAEARPHDGALAHVSGLALTRGDLDMLQINGVTALDAPPPALAPDTPLGRWRLVGEICDGKCYAGAMRPGTGLSHKACANLCLVGDIPPVFVSTGPIEGQNFMLIGGPDGGPVTDALLDYTAVMVEVEAEVVRRGDLLILHIDPASLRIL